jgi:hypothetical protein
MRAMGMASQPQAIDEIFLTGLRALQDATPRRGLQRRNTYARVTIERAS